MLNSTTFYRQEYIGPLMEESKMPASPFSFFQNWLDKAIESNIREPNAMILSTIGESGCPSARVVLLKDFSESGFCFFTNGRSHKAEDIQHNPAVALTFYWETLFRQVRIEGNAIPVEATVADAYFALRPRGAQLSAWASSQSEVVGSRMVLEEQYHKAKERFANEPMIPRPPHWGGFCVVPVMVEFWQGQENRLHDRVRYTRLGEVFDNVWQRDRLAP